MTNNPIVEILSAAKKLAQKYHALTGKPLGITGEVAEYEVATHLKGITLTAARQAGYDAIELRNGKEFHLQIKGRRLLKGSRSGHIGSIDINKEFDAVLLVLLDENFDATAIYEAPRTSIISALKKPGSKARNFRNSLAITKFKAIAQVRWERPDSK